MKSRCFVAKVEGVFPIYIQKKNEKTGKLYSEKTKDIEKVLIYGLTYVVQKDSVKVGDDVIVIREGSQLGKDCPEWLKFIPGGRVRKSRKCGVTSHGVVIPNADATKMLDAPISIGKKISDDVTIRDIATYAIDDALKVTKRLSHAEKRMLKDCQEEIQYFTNEIKKIMEA